MVESLLALALFARPLPHRDTTEPFADAATRALVERAIGRYHAPNADLTDCHDRIGYRRSAAFGRRGWVRFPATVVGEAEDCYSVFDRRWFLPRGLQPLYVVQLAGRSDSLPPDITGERAQGISFEKPSDPLRYDRVQGWSFGLGYRVRVPAIEFAGVQGTIRYGISDERLTGRLSFLRDAPTGRLAVSGYRDVVDVDPISRGQTVGNTLNAIFAAHDNADYMLATGGSASFATSLVTGWELAVGARVERQRSVVREAESDVNDFFGGDGLFPENAPIAEGTFVGGTVSLSGNVGPRWSVTVDALGGEGLFTGRVFGEIRQSFGGARGATIRAKAGIATNTDLAQMQFRAGGVNTVRGFDYGTLRGQAFWAAQLDVAPIRGRVRPVLFADAGRASAPSDLFEGRVLVGAGIGVSVFGGLLRLDLSRRLSPGDGTLRFDVTAGAPR